MRLQRKSYDLAALATDLLAERQNPLPRRFRR